MHKNASNLGVKKIQGSQFLGLFSYFLFFNKKEILKKDAKIKFDWHIDPLDFGSQLMKVHDLVDFSRMLKPLDKKDLQSFFEKEALKLGKEIIE